MASALLTVTVEFTITAEGSILAPDASTGGLASVDEIDVCAITYRTGWGNVVMCPTNGARAFLAEAIMEQCGDYVAEAIWENK